MKLRRSTVILSVACLVLLICCVVTGGPLALRWYSINSRRAKLLREFEQKLSSKSNSGLLSELLGVKVDENAIMRFRTAKDIDGSYTLHAAIFVDETTCLELENRFGGKTSIIELIADQSEDPYKVTKSNYDFSIVSGGRVEREHFPFGVEGTSQSIYLDFSKSTDGLRLLNVFMNRLGGY